MCIPRSQKRKTKQTNPRKFNIFFKTKEALVASSLKPSQTVGNWPWSGLARGLAFLWFYSGREPRGKKGYRLKNSQLPVNTLPPYS